MKIIPEVTSSESGSRGHVIEGIYKGVLRVLPHFSWTHTTGKELSGEFAPPVSEEKDEIVPPHEKVSWG